MHFSKHNKICDEVLNNIQKSLQECKDNQKIINISGIVNIHNCKNIQYWLNDVYYHIGLRMEIKNPVIENNYRIKYIVNKRLLIIN